MLVLRVLEAINKKIRVIAIGIRQGPSLGEVSLREQFLNSFTLKALEMLFF